MSLSPENYRIIKKKYETLVEQIESYFERYENVGEYFEPLVYLEEVETLIDAINKEKGEIELGAKNLKTEAPRPGYLEMLDTLNSYLGKLRMLKRGRTIDFPANADALI